MEFAASRGIPHEIQKFELIATDENVYLTGYTLPT